MRKYKVVIRGRNYLLPFDGEPQKVGFSQNFFIRAETPADAQREAVGLVARDPMLVQNAMNGSEDPVRVVVESVKWAGPFKLFTIGPEKRDFFLEEEGSEADGKAAGNQG